MPKRKNISSEIATRRTSRDRPDSTLKSEESLLQQAMTSTFPTINTSFQIHESAKSTAKKNITKKGANKPVRTDMPMSRSDLCILGRAKTKGEAKCQGLY